MSGIIDYLDLAGYGLSGASSGAALNTNMQTCVASSAWGNIPSGALCEFCGDTASGLPTVQQIRNKYSAYTDLSVSAAAIDSTKVATAMLDSNHVVVAWTSGATVNVKVLTINISIVPDNWTITSGNALSTAGGGTPSIAVLSPTKAVIFCPTSSSGISCTVLDATNPSSATLGTTVYISGVAQGAAISAAGMTTTSALVTYQKTTLNAMVVTVSGTTITTHTEYVLNASVTPSCISVASLSTVDALVSYIDPSNSYGCRVISIYLTSTYVVNYSTVYSVNSATNNASSMCRVCKLDPNKSLVMFIAADSTLYSAVVYSSGTNVTVGLQYHMNSAASASLLNIGAIDSEHALAVYYYSSGMYANPILISSPTVTSGLANIVYSGAATMTGCNGLAILDPTHFLMIYTTSSNLYAVVLKQRSPRPQMVALSAVNAGAQGNFLLQGIGTLTASYTSGVTYYGNISGNLYSSPSPHGESWGSRVGVMLTPNTILVGDSLVNKNSGK